MRSSEKITQLNNSVVKEKTMMNTKSLHHDEHKEKEKRKGALKIQKYAIRVAALAVVVMATVILSEKIEKNKRKHMR